jgi:hypothetical protein
MRETARGDDERERERVVTRERERAVTRERERVLTTREREREI